MRCAVYNCCNTNNNSLDMHRFHGFPRDEELLKKWINFCRRNDNFNHRTSRICGEHFSPDDYIRNMQYEMGLCGRNALKLKPGTVPTLETTNPKYDRRKKCSIPTKAVPEPVAISRVSIETCPINCVSVKTEPEEFIGDTIETFIITTLNEEVKEEVIEEVKEEEISEIEIESEKITEHNVDSFEFIDSVKVPTLPDNQQRQAQLKALKEELADLSQTKIFLQKSAQKNASTIHALKRRLVKAVYERDNMQEKLLQIFSTEQVNSLKNGTETQAWTQADIEHSNLLYTASAKAYTMLRLKGFPLPDVETLNNWKKRKTDTSSSM